jgi:hypothetical protein
MAGERSSPLSRVFRWYGRKVARHPLVFLVFSALSAGVLALGMRYITIDSDPDVIWVPPTSNTALQKQYFDSAFDPFFRINQVIISLDETYLGNQRSQQQVDFSVSSLSGRSMQNGAYGSAANLGNVTPAEAVGILTPEYLLAVWELQNLIVNNMSHTGVTLDDICYKPIVGTYTKDINLSFLLFEGLLAAYCDDICNDAARSPLVLEMQARAV